MAFESLSEKITQTIRNLAGKSQLSERNMDETLKDIRIALLEADVNYVVVKNFLNNLKEKVIGQQVLSAVEPGQMLVKLVNDELIALLGSNDQELNFLSEGISTVMVVGLQGSGKTTNIAKIAKLLKEKKQRRVLLVAGDLQRPAAIEQLKTLGQMIDVEVFSLGLNNTVINTAYEASKYAQAKNYDTILFDTAGRLQIDEQLMTELEELKAILKPQEILLTVDALTGQDIINVAKEFHGRLNVTGLLVTKFDGDSKGGAILSVKSIADVAVKFVGVGEKIDDLEVFYPDRYASRILGMGDVLSLVEKAQAQYDEKEAQKDMEKLLSGKFSLDDLLKQIEQTQKMGPFKNILKLLPGMGEVSKQLENVDTDSHFKKAKAIIQSMTKYEKQHPEELRSSHKRRIALGSGTSVNDINKLINQFIKSKKMMQQMKGLFRQK